MKFGQKQSIMTSLTVLVLGLGLFVTPGCEEGPDPGAPEHGKTALYEWNQEQGAEFDRVVPVPGGPVRPVGPIPDWQQAIQDYLVGIFEKLASEDPALIEEGAGELFELREGIALDIFEALMQEDWPLDGDGENPEWNETDLAAAFARTAGECGLGDAFAMVTPAGSCWEMDVTGPVTLHAGSTITVNFALYGPHTHTFSEDEVYNVNETFGDCPVPPCTLINTSSVDLIEVAVTIPLAIPTAQWTYGVITSVSASLDVSADLTLTFRYYLCPQQVE